MTYVRSDEKQADAVERVLDRVEAYPFEIELLVADSGFYNERVIRRSREIAATVVPVAEEGDLPEEFMFSVFCDWIRHALEQELERRWKIEMNGIGVPDAYTAAAG